MNLTNDGFDGPPIPTTAAPDTDGSAFAPSVVRIRPTSGWRVLDLAELWKYRELLLFLVWRDVKVRYRQTVLGIAWAVLQPLLMMGVFYIFFGRVANLPSDGVPYPLFAFAGLLPWLFFSSSLGSAGNSVVGSERLVTKIYFPRIVIPFAAVGASVIDFLVACGVFALLVVGFVACGQPVNLGWSLLLAPLFFALILMAALAIGTGLAALNVKYRDFRYVIPFLTQFWMFATPTVYMAPKADDGGLIGLLMWVNPMTGLIGGFRAACLGLDVPWPQVAVSAVVVVVAFVFSCFYFRRVEGDFADVI